MDSDDVVSGSSIHSGPVEVAEAVRIKRLGCAITRYGLALVIVWIGFMKFTAYEAKGIEPLVAHSPLMAWMLNFMTVRTLAAGLGVVEVTTGLLIASRQLSPRAAQLGSLLAVATFLTTLTFLLSTPGVWAAPAGGFPALSADIGQFLIKDVVLLGASVWLLGEAMTVTKNRAHPIGRALNRQ